MELLIILFEGVQIFEHTRILTVHEKFVNDLDVLGNALSLLINKALCLAHNKNVIIILLSAVQSLSEIQNMLKYYIPKDVVMRKLSFPILDDPWQQLIQRITNFGEDNCKNIMVFTKIFLFTILFINAFIFTNIFAKRIYILLLYFIRNFRINLFYIV